MLAHGSAGTSSAARLAFEYLMNKVGTSLMHIALRPGKDISGEKKKFRSVYD